MALKELIFYYDVICPYAFVASKLVESLAQRTGATLKWRPVLLGGIYNHIRPKEDAKKRPAQMMPPAKLLSFNTDLRRLFQRHGIASAPEAHKIIPDLSTLNAMRLIVSSPGETSDIRRNITHALYDAVWIHKQDVSDVDVLQRLTDKIKWNVNVKEIVLGNSENGKQKLIDNTAEAVERTAFGVPSFWVNEKLYFGTDRMFLVERELGNTDAQPLRIQPKPVQQEMRKKLTVYHDVSSPYCDLGMLQVDSLIDSCRPVKVDVEYVPILLGALFKAIGTPELPMRHLPVNRQRYMFRDLQMGYDVIGKPTAFTSNFPFFTMTCQRLMVSNNGDEKLRKLLYDAAWRKEINITEKDVLIELLNDNGYDGVSMVEKTNDPSVKQKLKDNTTRAVDNGACGLPSFQVDDGQMIWGQDRINIVADLLCGATDVEPFVESKL